MGTIRSCVARYTAPYSMPTAPAQAANVQFLPPPLCNPPKSAAESRAPRLHDEHVNTLCTMLLPAQTGSGIAALHEPALAEGQAAASSTTLGRHNGMHARALIRSLHKAVCNQRQSLNASVTSKVKNATTQTEMVSSMQESAVTTDQSGKVPGMRAPLNSSSSDIPGKQLSQIRSGPVSGVSTYIL